MKRVKKGFTLAEVLITLAIIGVVAALTIPTLMADSRYQLISSRIAKFRSTTEDAALAYSAMNEKIDADGLKTIILYKSYDATSKTYELKDDTTLKVDQPATAPTISSDYGSGNEFNSKYGYPLLTLQFSPNVNGLSNVKSTFDFVMTDKGYVMPNSTDKCLEALFSKDKKGKMDQSMAAATTDVCNKSYTTPKT